MDRSFTAVTMAGTKKLTQIHSRIDELKNGWGVAHQESLDRFTSIEEKLALQSQILASFGETLTTSIEEKLAQQSQILASFGETLTTSIEEKLAQQSQILASLGETLTASIKEKLAPQILASLGETLTASIEEKLAPQSQILASLGETLTASIEEKLAPQSQILASLGETLTSSIEEKLAPQSQILASLGETLTASIEEKLAPQSQILASLGETLTASIEEKLAPQSQILASLGETLTASIEEKLAPQSQILASLGETLTASIEEKLAPQSQILASLGETLTRIESLHRVEKSKGKSMEIPTEQQSQDMSLAVQEPESEEEPKKYLNEKQQENEDLLVKCISQNLGYAGGKPVAACVIYKCLLHWRSFEVEITSVFSRIIETIASAIEVPDDNEVLAYWLSNSATLLSLLQRTLNATGAASLTSASLFFKQQLTAFLEKIYGMIRDNLKKEISTLLELCIQGGRAQANAVAQQDLIAHWQSIRKNLNSYLNLMKANNAPPFLVRKVFTQIFHFINVQLFNSLLLRRECCSFSNGEYVKAGLAKLEQWCVEATDEYAGAAWYVLMHIRQAVGFLVSHQKPEKTIDEITRQLCPVLSIQQLYRISTMYWDDKYGTHSVSTNVITNMKVMMTDDSNNDVSSSFLLEDDLSIQLPVVGLSKSMQQVDVNDIEPPQLIRQNSGFGFLLTHKEGSTS